LWLILTDEFDDFLYLRCEMVSFSGTVFYQTGPGTIGGFEEEHGVSLPEIGQGDKPYQLGSAAADQDVLRGYFQSFRKPLPQFGRPGIGVLLDGYRAHLFLYSRRRHERIGANAEVENIIRVQPQRLQLGMVDASMHAIFESGYSPFRS